MKKKATIKTINPILPVLALLLLFSSCKVRNFIQGELNLPLTEVSNKNKTTIDNCNDIELDTGKIIKYETPLNFLPLAIKESESIFYDSIFFINYIQAVYFRKHSSSSVPLYILYQNFKDYL